MSQTAWEIAVVVLLAGIVALVLLGLVRLERASSIQ